jgi:hypothetical protein
LEMCLHTFHERTSSQLGGATRNYYVPAARLYDRDVLAKSGRYRDQHTYCRSQKIVSHVSPPIIECAATGNILRSSDFVKCDSPPMVTRGFGLCSPH